MDFLGGHKHQLSDTWRTLLAILPMRYKSSKLWIFLEINNKSLSTTIFPNLPEVADTAYFSDEV